MVKLATLYPFYVLYNIHHPEPVAARYPGVIRQILTHHAYCTLYLIGQPEKVSCMKATINDGSVPGEHCHGYHENEKPEHFPTFVQVSLPMIMPVIHGLL